MAVEIPLKKKYTVVKPKGMAARPRTGSAAKTKKATQGNGNRKRAYGPF